MIEVWTDTTYSLNDIVILLKQGEDEDDICGWWILGTDSHSFFDRVHIMDDYNEITLQDAKARLSKYRQFDTLFSVLEMANDRGVAE